ncbi:uncharacterized protein MONBRDRAFT_26425 [Monosiga brevicollis MX1]|uniref:Ubiquitin-like domain-containing protein n=1 Tax=Monosiga brevicollis TaxID=81824 RepID=A9V2C0_MONBE|nr:uncharacterized protein MONBRDRAFT_26425 [Monosiga brevicollis MX1]EDQ88349.1 predicted protein [Monosiga brevicollis MX1]|eukprot:XP_001746942.1 hypothetical protein [Monosiga brevicollis MX1]
MGKKKGAKKKGSKKAPEKPPKIPGHTLGGMPMFVHALSGRPLEVTELRFATIAALKERVAELTKFSVDCMTLLFPTTPQDPDGHSVASIRAFRPSWPWPADLRVRILHDAATLSASGLKEHSVIYVLVRLQVMAGTNVFEREDDPIKMMTKRAGQRFLQLARGRPVDPFETAAAAAEEAKAKVKDPFKI